MTLPRTISTYGGPYSDAYPVDDPTTSQSSAFGNREHEDVAQMTRTTEKAWVQFSTRLSNGAATVLAGQSHMGVGSGQLPTVARSGAGVYAVTYPATWSDALNVAEAISFVDASGSVVSTSTSGRVQVVPAGNVLNVWILSNAAGVDTPSDLTGGVTIRVEAR